MGDGSGIGPEVTVLTIADPSIRRLARFLVLGDYDSINKAKALFQLSIPLHKVSFKGLAHSTKRALNDKSINIFDPGTRGDGRDPVRYIDSAVSLIRRGIGSALVTAPVNKESITRSGIKFSGHTEYLAQLTKTKKVAMMFCGGKIRATVVTRHIPLKDVSGVITKKNISDATLLTYRFLKNNLKLKRPRVGICALNPHAGEGGTLGREEVDIICPAIKSLRKDIPHISGPIPADSAFNLLYHDKVDCLIAMYHDQAMVPVKTFGREKCVNITLGLPFVRTSPVHGTAYDIAGQGIADPSSMKEATRLACHLIENIRRTR